MRVDEHTIELAGSPVFLRQAPGPKPPPLYLHGVPTSSDDWTAVLERTGGIAVDLPGFGRTGKGGQLDLSPGGHATFLAELLDHLDVPQVTVVAHGWGAAGAVALADRHPDRVARMVLVSPLGPGGVQRGLARVLRARVLGELTMGSVNRRRLGRAIQSASAPDAWPPERLDAVWAQFDQGTQRAILRLYRVRESLPTAPPAVPVTILHGAEDPRWPPETRAAWLALAPHAEVHELPGIRHWPWLESPRAAELIAELATR